VNPMPSHEAKQKLTAILVADVKGYSRLMGEDKAWAAQALSTYKEILVAHIQDTKDALSSPSGTISLPEFPNAADAVQCAVEIQKELKIRNAQLPENRRMESASESTLEMWSRRGINFRDGVNVAAKMESLSAAGGACISRPVYDYVRKKLALGMSILGSGASRTLRSRSSIPGVDGTQRIHFRD